MEKPKTYDGLCEMQSLQCLCINTLVSRRCLHFSEDDMITLPENLKSQVLHLMCKRGQVTDDNIDKIVHQNTVSLDLLECEISDVGLMKLPDCRFLTYLNLNAHKEPRCNISSLGVENLVRRCPKLQVVYIRRCVLVSDQAIIALAHSCPHIKELDISGCVEVADKSMEALSGCCSGLRSINISCTQVTDQGIIILTSGPCANKLQEIVMERCKFITVVAIQAILEQCPNISILNFNNCPGISDVAREAVSLRMGPRSKLKLLSWTVY